MFKIISIVLILCVYLLKLKKNIMIVSEVFYGVKCNRCGEQYEDGEHSFWSDESGAVENAMQSEWIDEKGKHYCGECHEYNEEKDENLPLPDFPEHVKKIKNFIEKIIVGHSFYIKENSDSFKISKTLYNQIGLNSNDTNYITDFLGNKLESIDVEKHERYSSYEVLIVIKKNI